MRIWNFLPTLLAVFFTQTTQAQQGLPFMADVELSRQFSDSRVSSMVQDGEMSMFFASTRGLLKYDGATWERVKTPSSVQRTSITPHPTGSFSD